MTDLQDRIVNTLARYKSDMEILQEQREKAHKEYMGDKYGDEVAGRSQVVMSDIFDTVEWIMPSLMRIFYGGQDVCKINPRGPEDEQGANLLGEKVNFDISRINGYTLFHDWFKDALIYKLGVIKYWWDVQETFKERKYSDLTTEEYMMLKSNPDFIIDKEETSEEVVTDPVMGATFVTTSYYVEGRERKVTKGPKAEVVPPEELLFNVFSKDIKGEDIVDHYTRKHKSYISREYGIKEEDMAAEEDLFLTDTLYQERFKDLGGVDWLKPEDDPDYYWLHEVYVNEWVKGQKKAKRLIIMGGKVLKEEENSYGCPPFCFLTPIRIPHRAIGRCFSDLLSDLQRMRTALIRYILDNIYYQNNGRAVINPWRINVDDLLSNNRPGGYVRTTENIDPDKAIFPMPINPLPAHAYQMIEVADQMKENRTGITKYNQGSDAQSLNKTATGISQIMSASMQRQELIARSFAETGVKDLFAALAKLNIDYLDTATNIRINNEWQSVDPQAIDVEYDLTIDVGIGTGTKEMTVQQMTDALQISVNPVLMQTGLVTPENIYEIMKTRYEAMGYKNAGRFITEPQGGMNGMVAPMGAPIGGPGADPAALLEQAGAVPQGAFGGVGGGGIPPDIGFPGGGPVF